MTTNLGYNSVEINLHDKMYIELTVNEHVCTYSVNEEPTTDLNGEDK